MTGIATNYCVDKTCREAVAYGYDMILVSDATRQLSTSKVTR
jgi:nicotinamidase-related amidase